MNTQKFAKIQDILTEMVETGAAAGGSCLIYKDDEEKCYYEAGYADRENKVPVKRDTIFRLYSMTKPMTAVAAMLLVQDGKLFCSDTGMRCRNTVKKIPPTSDICPHNAEKIEQKFQNYEKKYNYNC